MRSLRTDHAYLNEMIDLAISDGIVTEDEIEYLIEMYGTNHRLIAIDILSFVYQRRQDQKKILTEMQEIYHRSVK